MAVQARGPLARSVAETATDLWNDSCGVDELETRSPSARSARRPTRRSSATCGSRDPATLAGGHPRSRRRASRRGPRSTSAWAIVEAMSLRAAPLLLPAFERSGGRQGRLSMQTNPTLLADTRPRCSSRASTSTAWPRTSSSSSRPPRSASASWRKRRTGASASTARSASASPRRSRRPRRSSAGLRRREADGLPVDRMGPVITIMMGRIEDWLRVQIERDGIVVDPAALPWSGVAVFKRAYGIFRERGLRARLLGAAIRHHYHWSELIGGDVVITLPPVWQRRFDASDVEVRPRMDDPVADRPSSTSWRRHLPDFVRAYEPGRAVGRRVRRLPADRPHPAGVHRLVPRAARRGRSTRSCPTPTVAPERRSRPALVDPGVASMDLCLYTDSVADLSFEAALDLAAEIGCRSIEIAGGGQSSRAPPSSRRAARRPDEADARSPMHSLAAGCDRRAQLLGVAAPPGPWRGPGGDHPGHDPAGRRARRRDRRVDVRHAGRRCRGAPPSTGSSIRGRTTRWPCWPASGTSRSRSGRTMAAPRRLDRRPPHRVRAPPAPPRLQRADAAADARGGRPDHRREHGSVAPVLAADGPAGRDRARSVRRSSTSTSRTPGSRPIAWRSPACSTRPRSTMPRQRAWVFRTVGRVHDRGLVGLVHRGAASGRLRRRAVDRERGSVPVRASTASARPRPSACR